MKILVIFTILVEITTCEYDRRIITTLKYSRYRVKPVIVNGEPAIQGQVPYLVSIKEPISRHDSRRVVWTNLCGGSIISKLRVLTAAHCFEGNNFYYERRFDKLRLVAGNLKNDIVHSGQTVTIKHAQWRQIQTVKVHKNFEFPNNDIALVFVSDEWRFNDEVNFIPTASRQTDYPRTCYSAGFGRTSHNLNSLSPVMLIARIDVMPRFKCSLLWEMNMNSYICTDSALTDVSMGDSGGPLTCSNILDPVGRSGKDVLVGVVSGKNFDKTTLYTRVSYFRDWIETDASVNMRFNRYFMLIILFSLIYL